MSRKFHQSERIFVLLGLFCYRAVSDLERLSCGLFLDNIHLPFWFQHCYSRKQHFCIIYYDTTVVRNLEVFLIHYPGSCRSVENNFSTTVSFYPWSHIQNSHRDTYTLFSRMRIGESFIDPSSQQVRPIAHLLF